jgi:hypothetical protein
MAATPAHHDQEHPMKRHQPDPEPEKAPVATPIQCKHWWDSVATWIAEIEDAAETYLHGGALDEAAASEIMESLAAAKASADCAFGAYHRISKAAVQPLPQARATQATTPQQQPTYG